MAKEDIGILVALKGIAQTVNGLRKINKTVKSVGLSGNEAASAIQSSIEGAKGSISKFTGRLQGLRIQFQGWALSILFFGMALKNLFSSIFKESSKVFNEVMHSVEDTVTGFDMLNNSMTFLSYVIGQALEPIAFLLFPIIDKVAEWVMQNEELVRKIFVIGIALGTVAFLVGFLVLAATGILELGLKIVGIISWVVKGFLTLQPVLAMIVGFGLTPILLIIGAIVLAVIALAAMWATNFGGMQDKVKAVFASIWETIKNVVKGLGEVFGGLFKILKGLFTGDVDLIFQGLISIIIGAVRIIVNIAFTAASAIYNIFAFIVNAVMSLFINMIIMIWDIIKRIAAFASTFGFEIDTSSLDTAIDYLSSVRDGAQLGTMDTSAQDWVNNFLDGIQQSAGNQDNRTINIEMNGTTDDLLAQLLAILESNN